MKESSFTYETKWSYGLETYLVHWKLSYHGYEITGISDNIPQAYRQGRRALKRLKRMVKDLET